MREALPKNDPAYGSVQNIDGRLYVGGAGPEAKRAREREEARERQRAQEAERAEAERARVEEATARYGPALEAWPAVRAELHRHREEAEERLRVALVESPVFGALLDVLSAQRAEFRGAQQAGAQRAEITRQPYLSSTPPKPLDLLELVRSMADESAVAVLTDAREQVATPAEEAG